MKKTETFTIQFRMTKKCNAECSYCIAPYWEDKAMSLSEFQHSIDYIVDEYFPSLGVDAGSYVDLEFVGGEVSLLPLPVLTECVEYARIRFREAGYVYSDGCQSNFIGNTNKLDSLWHLFDGNMTTSIEHFSEQRKLNGSSKKYKDRFFVNIEKVCNEIPMGSVFVLDKSGLENAVKEAMKALKEGYAIGMYPAYEANNPVDNPTSENMARTLVEILNMWVLNYNTPIEPINHLFRMVVNDDTTLCGSGDACPFTFGCSTKSLCVEPNGDLYICMDMAETKKHKIGNALENTHDSKLLRKLGKRGIILNPKCDSCKYRQYCKGGCLNHAMINGNEFSPSEFCSVWYSILEASEKLVEKHGRSKLKEWLSKQDIPKFYC